MGGSEAPAEEVLTRREAAMAQKVKFGKIAIVAFITVLIWVWADRALDEEFPVPSGAAITIARTEPSLWVSFGNRASVPVTKIVLRGPVSKIADVRRGFNDGSLVLRLFLDPEQTGMTSPGGYPLDVLGFLRRSDQIRKHGVTVESCEPRALTVNVVGLFKKQLRISCVDRDQNPIEGATITPAVVDMFVPEDWTGEAKVQLGQREIEQARLTPVGKVPYIELGGQIREAAVTVEVATPPEGDRLEEYLVTATLGITISPAMQGRFTVEVTNLNEVMSPVAIRATPEAKVAYEMQPIPTMTLYILDDDKKTAEPQRRAVVYNFPPEFVRRKDIELKNPQPVEARFRLIPIPQEPQPSAPR